MIVRKAMDKDKDEIKRLWKYCFNDSKEFMDFYFSDIYNNENIVVGEEDNKVLCALQIKPYKIKVNSLEYNASYVVGVSTKPEVRGQGLMSQLMNQAIKDMYEAGQGVSLLMPIDNGLYESFGYGFVSDQLKYKINVDAVPRQKNDVQLEPVEDKHLPLLVDYYASSMSNKKAYVNRDEELFKKILMEIHSEGGYTYVALDKEDKVVGYLFYYLEDNKMEVREMNYSSKEILFAFLNFIKLHGTQIKEVNLYESTDGYLKYVISNSDQNEIRVVPFMMARIINLREFCKSIRLNKKAFGSITIRVLDDILPANDKTFAIDFDGNAIRLNHTRNQPDITLTIGRLTQLLLGYLTYNDIVFLDELKYNEKADKLLQCIKQDEVNYFNEYI